jgi:hypothetical protein
MEKGKNEINLNKLGKIYKENHIHEYRLAKQYTNIGESVYIFYCIHCLQITERRI